MNKHQPKIKQQDRPLNFLNFIKLKYEKIETNQKCHQMSTFICDSLETKSYTMLRFCNHQMDNKCEKNSKKRQW